MKNKKLMLSIFFIILFTALLIGTAFAENLVNVVINGVELRPTVPFQIVNNRVVAPVRQVAETLGATVEWDEENQTVRISNEDQRNLEIRVSLLESALIPLSPEEAANTWAKSIMTRNGAVQYAILSEELKTKYKADYEMWNWMIGASSPWIDSYEISDGKEQPDGTWKYTIDYHYTDSAKEVDFTRTTYITVGSKQRYQGSKKKWYVQNIEYETME